MAEEDVDSRKPVDADVSPNAEQVQDALEPEESMTASEQAPAEDTAVLADTGQDAAMGAEDADAPVEEQAGEPAAEDATGQSAAADVAADADVKPAERSDAAPAAGPEASVEQSDTQLEPPAATAVMEPLPSPASGTSALPAGAVAAAAPAPACGKWRKIVLIVAIVIVALLAIAIAALALDDGNRTKKVPQTTMLDGKVNVSGMTAEELDKTVSTRVKNGFTTKVELSAGGKAYTIDLSEVGTLDAQATVDEAFAPYDVPFYERYWDRLMTLLGGQKHVYEISTAIAPDSEKLTEQVEAIAKKADRKAEDAGYKYSGGKLVTTKAQDGVSLDVQATVQAIVTALSGDVEGSTAKVEAVVETTKAKNAKPGKAIFVDLGSCMLYLYDNGKVTFKTPCTPGQSGYATPTGDWTLSAKVRNPTWTNPGSDWASNMPETIGPGRSNPMGLRKLAVSCGGGIYIHGTDNIGALGSPGSHGCIRISNDEVVKLFDMVEVGIPIIIR